MIGLPTRQEDANVKAFIDFLTTPASRCIVCLVEGAEVDVKYWRDHPRLGRVFVCDRCAPKRRSEVIAVPSGRPLSGDDGRYGHAHG